MTYVSKFRTELFLLGAICLIVLCLGVVDAFASSTSTGMPWEGPITKIKNSLTGPFALGVSVIAMAVTGFALVFGGAELTGAVKALIGVVFVIAIIMSAGNLITMLFGGGAVIADAATVTIRC